MDKDEDNTKTIIDGTETIQIRREGRIVWIVYR